MKAIIERQLPLSDTYKFLWINRQGIEGGNACACDNCGKVIVNMAGIQNQKGECFTVGLDCLKMLTKALRNFTDYDDAVYDFNQTVRFMTLYNKAESTQSDGTFVYATTRNKKGQSVATMYFKHLIDKFGFQL